MSNDEPFDPLNKEFKITLEFVSEAARIEFEHEQYLKMFPKEICDLYLSDATVHAIIRIGFENKKSYEWTMIELVKQLHESMQSARDKVIDIHYNQAVESNRPTVDPMAGKTFHEKMKIIWAMSSKAINEHKGDQS